MNQMLKQPEYVNGDEDQRKELVGDEIYEFVEKIVGEKEAPKVTGMIIDLPNKDLFAILHNFKQFSDKVNEGLKLIKSSSSK